MNKAKSRRILGLGLACLSLGIVGWLITERIRERGSEGGSALEERVLPKGKRPVVLITLDTTRADHLEPYGAKEISTPTLRRLALEGTLFEQAYAVAPITLVAHTSILSGLYPFQHGVRNNGIQYVPDEVSTLAERLVEEGYRTGAFVSAAVLDHRYGLDQGFETYDDDLSTGRDRRPRMVADRPAEAVVDSASGWLDTVDEGDRYFLWAHFYDPHAIYSPPPPYRDRYRERLYDGEISYMDAQIGRLLDHPRLKAGEPPIVVVIGDHGESLGEHNEKTHAMLAYDSTLHVPFLIKVPGATPGVRVQGNVSQVDLLPTLLDILDLRGDDGSGRSLVGPMLGRPEVERPIYSETYLPFYTYGWAKLKVLRQGRWKFINAPTPELFNLIQDPRELSNVHEREVGIAHDLTRDLSELLQTVEDAELEAGLALDSESEEKLRSLGYLSTGSSNSRVGPRPDPKDVISLHVGLELSRQLLQDRLFDRAETELRKVLDKDRTNLAALVDLVRALEGQRRIDEAIATAEQALRIDPDYTRMFLMLARLEADRGQLDKALELANLAIDKDPNSPDFFLMRIRLLAQDGRVEELTTDLESGVLRFEGEPKIEVAYAQFVELAQGRLGAAEERLRRATDRDPFYASGWSTLGRALERDDRRQEARAAYELGLQYDSVSVDLHGSLGTLLVTEGDWPQGVQHLREAIRLSPAFIPTFHVTLGGALAEMGQTQLAQGEYRRVLEVFPRHPAARNNLAVALRRSGDLQGAQALLQEVLVDDPNNVDALNNLSAIAIDTNDWTRAERYARQALELKRSLPEAWNNLGIALEEQGQTESSVESYRRALALDDAYWPAQLNLGIVLGRIGQEPEALEMLGLALEQAPQLPTAHYEMGKLLAGPLRDPSRARAHLSAFLKYAPADPRAAEVRQLLDGLPSSDH